MSIRRIASIILGAVLIGLIAATVVCRLDAAGKLGSLNDEQIQSLRYDYPLHQAECPVAEETAATDLETIIETSNAFVEAEVTGYRQGYLSVVIRNIVYLGGGISSPDPMLAIKIRMNITIRTALQTGAGCAIDHPEFKPGDRYLFPLDIRPESAPIGSDDYTLRPEGMFYIADGTHVLTVYNAGGEPSPFDGWRLNQFIREVYHIRGEMRTFDDGLNRSDMK